jgi:hypothetical protein
MGESGWKSTLTSVARWLLRSVVLGGVVFTLWVVVGSIWYPGWWFAAILCGGLLNRSFLIGDYFFFSGGFKYLLEHQIWLFFCIAGISLAIVVAAVFFPEKRARFIKAVDRWSILIISFCAFSLFVNALILYMTVDRSNAEIWMNKLDDSYQPPAETPRGTIYAPVDFIYVDGDRVAQIYSEIEPELVEQRRILSTEKKSGESVGIEVGGATLKAEASKRGQATSEYQRSESTASRKCIELMNFMLKNRSANYFTTKEEFYMRPEVSPVRYLLVYGQVSPELKNLIEKQDSIAKERDGVDELFKREARNFVIVEGAFHISRTNGTIQFEEEFSPQPQRIVFRFTLPARADSELFRDGRIMRVFADVTQQLDNRGVIEIYPLAVF